MGRKIFDLGDLEVSEAEEKLGLRLIRRLHTNRLFNIEALKRTMIKVWDPTSNIVIRVFGPNLFAFQFFHYKNREKALNSHPWCFDNIIIILK